MDDEKKDGISSDDRPKFQGEWKCAKCEADITELPFQPREDQPLYCKECYRSRQGETFSRKPMVQGQWKCSKCKADITELPFQPSDDQQVFCRECYRTERPRRNFRE